MVVRVLVLCLSLCLVISCDTTMDSNSQANKETLQSKPKSLISENMSPGEVSLFDGKDLGQWKITDFGGQGKVYAKEESIIMEIGNDLTGVTWSGPVLRTNYEINYDAMRLDGEDFFCALTFPVDDFFVTFIVGGWGGNVCGLSSVNYFDASDNETTVKKSFDNNRWYHIRVRVEPGRIQCWIGKKQFVDLETKGKKLSTRSEVEESKPLGISCWQTKAAIKNISFTKLPDTQKKATSK